MWVMHSPRISEGVSRTAHHAARTHCPGGGGTSCRWSATSGGYLVCHSIAAEWAIYPSLIRLL